MKIEPLWKSPEAALAEDHPALGEWLRGRPEFRDHVIFRTSGSSGLQKWIALSKEALEWSATRVIDYLQLTSRDVCGLALPTAHVGGFGLALRAHLTKASLPVFGGKWQPQRFQKWCADEGVTVTSLVPTQVNDLTSVGLVAPPKLRSIVVGGGVFHPEAAARARELGWPVLPSYGMTETSAQVATGEGLPLLPGWEARIDDGRLALKGGGLLSAIIVPDGNHFEGHDPKANGWFLTQDLASLSGRHLTLLGRADRQVKVLGKLIDLEVLECFWQERLGCELALIACPHDRRENALLLFFEGAGAEIDSINLTLPGPERLLAWRQFDSLPRSALGKINRAELRDLSKDLRCFEEGDQKG